MDQATGKHSQSNCTESSPQHASPTENTKAISSASSALLGSRCPSRSYSYPEAQTSCLWCCTVQEKEPWLSIYTRQDQRACAVSHCCWQCTKHRCCFSPLSTPAPAAGKVKRAHLIPCCSHLLVIKLCYLLSGHFISTHSVPETQQGSGSSHISKSSLENGSATQRWYHVLWKAIISFD